MVLLLRSAFSQLSAPNPVITSVPPTMLGIVVSNYLRQRERGSARGLTVELVELAFHLEPLGTKAVTPTLNHPTHSAAPARRLGWPGWHSCVQCQVIPSVLHPWGTGVAFENTLCHTQQDLSS